MKDRRVTFNHNPLLDRGLPAWRPRFVLFVLLGCSLALVLRALYLQGVNKDFLQAKGESRYARSLEVPATRGRILDRHGEVLAMSSPVRSIWAIPADAKLEPAQARKLAALLDMSVAELNAKLATERDFVFIKRQLPPELAEQIAALKLPGIHQQSEFRRFYPGGEVMAHVVGFTGVDDTGQEGIELAFDKVLAGTPGLRRVIRDRRGRVVDDVEIIRPPRDGQDLVLSIDSKLQYLAHIALKQAVETHKAQGASAVVIDARSGEILALVNNPTYNPNNRGNLTGAQLRNRALTDTYEPGSTMKPFVAAMALEKRRFHFDSLIETGNGKLTIGPNTISDTSGHGVITVAQMVQKSSNVGAAKIALAFPPEEMHRFYASLGFGTPVGLGFPGEAGGRLRPAKTWKPIEQATMSYGHGMSTTLMNMAAAYLVLTRGGDKIPLSLIRREQIPTEGVRVMSPEVARDVRTMLEMVTMPGGTATKAQVPGYRVAGKTGTARKLEGGQYTTRKYVASFIGFAPASDPRLVVAVMIDEPSGGSYYGGSVAAPVFAQIVGGALRTLGIAPDAPLTQNQLVRQPDKPAAVRESM